MNFTFEPLEVAEVRAIAEWRYAGVYAVYNFSGNLDIALPEMLDRRSPYFAVFNDAELIGYFCYGTAAQVRDNPEPHLYDEDGAITIGLGLRPDLTGRGYGATFVQAGLDFAPEHYHPTYFRLFVMPFNQRAIKVYERVGFRQFGVYLQHTESGQREFIEMHRPL